MDKNQTLELAFSFKIILIGIFFWVIKVRYFTFFWLPEYHFLNVFGLEIVGTILIIVGISIIHRVYPFPYSVLANVLIYFILLINISEILLFRFKWFREIQQYSPFVMSIMLVIISKLMESGLRYFGNKDLSKEWKYLAIIILYGFSFPFYLYVSLNICGFIKYEGIKITPIILIFLPIFVALLSVVLYYLRILILSFKFLAKINKEGIENKKLHG